MIQMGPRMSKQRFGSTGGAGVLLGNAPRSPHSSAHPALSLMALAVLFSMALPIALAQAGLFTDEPPQVETPNDQDISALGLEELLNYNVLAVTSVTGNEHDLFKTPSAISVITSDDIRRAGHLNLPEALRLIPGMHVARLSSSQWAITSRGFNGRFANKLQVYIDGRTVYEPLFAGVLWNSVDLIINDIDRIEAIRGPGATLWGANSVNGVINITTKSAEDTLGAYATGGYGNEYQGFGAFRWGEALDDDSFYRIWGKYLNYDHLKAQDGSDRPDDWDVFHGGARFDFNTSSDSVFTVISDIHHSSRIGEGIRVPVPGQHMVFENKRVDGRDFTGNILARLRHEDTPQNWWQLQGYYINSDHVGVGGLEERRQTLNLDWRQSHQLKENLDLLWGLEFNLTADDIDGTSTIQFDPDSTTETRVSGFVQSTFELQPERWHLMLGSKIEHNSYTQLEVQPSGRIWYTPDDENTLWAAISRPVRTPSRALESMRSIGAYGDTGILSGGAPSGIYIPLTLNGNGNIESEDVMAYEAGYRKRINNNFSFDLSAFINNYDNVPSTPPSQIGTWKNTGSAETYGMEFAADWQVEDNWRVAGSFSILHQYLHGPVDQSIENDDPVHQFQIRSMLDLTSDLEFNSALYFVDNISGVDVAPSTRLDLGLTWRPYENMELSIWGQNLLDSSHREYDEGLFKDEPGESVRGVYLQAAIHF